MVCVVLFVDPVAARQAPCTPTPRIANTAVLSIGVDGCNMTVDRAELRGNVRGEKKLAVRVHVSVTKYSFTKQRVGYMRRA